MHKSRGEKWGAELLTELGRPEIASVDLELAIGSGVLKYFYTTSRSSIYALLLRVSLVLVV
jgi:hypothetical protein